MQIHLNLSFDNMQEFQDYLSSKHNAPVAVTTPAEPTSVPKGATSAEAATEAPSTPQPSTATTLPAAPSQEGVGQGPVAAPKKPVGRPKKADTPAPDAAKPAIKEEDVRAALMKVNDAYGADGLAKTAEIVQGFGVKFIKELKPEQYADVIKKAEEVVKAKAAS